MPSRRALRSVAAAAVLFVVVVVIVVVIVVVVIVVVAAPTLAAQGTAACSLVMLQLPLHRACRWHTRRESCPQLRLEIIVDWPLACRLGAWRGKLKPESMPGQEQVGSGRVAMGPHLICLEHEDRRVEGRVAVGVLALMRGAIREAVVVGGDEDATAEPLGIGEAVEGLGLFPPG